ncbi:MAG: tRNA (adenosine(37)-N6)-threonylcarbamoyltransferase complex dimerization subunit type 1 TsaB [Anaerolineae bacterium]|nr:tRNA (adenosine(37)-N6)-threonylcarbamoyltransferase complex dimerization subunit type 1 TsaB [Anaerolineae bacterium]
MNILALDTATQYAGLALLGPDGLLAEESWNAGRNHTVELMPRLVRMLKTAQLEMTDLTALAVALGPGSFTGLRIGLAVAKGIALPHKLAVVGVPTLEITAYPLKDRQKPVWAIAQAGRGRILAARFGLRKNKWQQLIEPYLTTIEELAPKITVPTLCTGEINQDAAKNLQQQSNHKALIVSPAERLRRPGYLAEIARQRLEAHSQDDPDALVPIYVSSPA